LQEIKNKIEVPNIHRSDAKKDVLRTKNKDNELGITVQTLSKIYIRLTKKEGQVKFY
jgi:hypothetical protein